MPNTVTIQILRERHRARYNHDSPLTHKQIHQLWTSTRRSRARGRHVSTTELKERLDQTLALMEMELTQ